MSQAVLDVSAAVDLVVAGPRQAAAVNVAAHFEEFTAPSLFDAEFASVLARLERAGRLSAPDCERALATLSRLRLARVLNDALLEDAWSLRHNLSTADAFYVALATRLSIPIITSDVRMTRSTGHYVQFHLVT